MGCCGEAATEGHLYVREDCGLEAKIVNGCGCQSCDLTCCDKPLRKKE